MSAAGTYLAWRARAARTAHLPHAPGERFALLRRVVRLRWAAGYEVEAGRMRREAANRSLSVREAARAYERACLESDLADYNDGIAMTGAEYFRGSWG